ncbi:hypothetical protein NC652_038779 [Populus alba x Populus x berolinensis]|nr:hypothetical protein NC652_038779 [Populus alba x Populus x berolinensis]
MSHSSLHCKLREILMGNKLFLVLDDFWNDDPEQSKFLITYLMGGAKPTTDVNRNTEWFTYPGVWTTYMLIVFMSWLLVLSIFGCSPGMAWTIVHFCHFAVSSLVCFLAYIHSAFSIGFNLFD